MKRTLTVLLLATVMLGVVAGPAAAFYCHNQDKKPGAGAVTFDELRVNKADRIVVPGAFLTVDEGVDIFIRGGDKHGATGTEKQLGAIPHAALDKGNPDHGLTELEFPEE